MTKALDRKLRTARLRLGADILLSQVGLFAALAGAMLLLAVVAERVFAVEILNVWWYAGVAGGAAVGAVVVWAIKHPGRLATAILIDERLALRERFSTALAFADSDDPFARAACREAHESAGTATIKGRFPIRPTRRWSVAGVAWVAFAAALLWLPIFDVLGNKAEADEVTRQKRALSEAKTDIKKAVSRVEAVVKQMDNPKLAEELAKLAKMQESGNVRAMKREAIKRIEDLAKQLDKLKAGEKMRGAQNLKDRLRQLRGSPKGLDNRLNQALAKARFAEAAKMLEEMRKRLDDARQLEEINKQLAEGKLTPEQAERLKQELADNKLTPEEAQKLAEQLDDLGRQLQELAKNQKELEDALAQAGCDKGLAQLSEEDLRQALKDAGLTDEQIDKLMQTAAACRNASAACQGLGEKMSLAGMQGGEGLTPEELAELIDQLGDMESLEGQLAMIEAALSECELAGACLGQGEAGEGGKIGGLLLAGARDGPLPKNPKWAGPTVGRGPGQASGDRPTGPDEDVTHTKTGVKNDPRASKPIGSWMVKGTQVRGEAKQEFKNVVQAAKDRAAEAISDSRIPREYQPAVKKYFGDLEKKSE